MAVAPSMEAATNFLQSLENSEDVDVVPADFSTLRVKENSCSGPVLRDSASRWSAYIRLFSRRPPPPALSRRKTAAHIRDVELRVRRDGQQPLQEGAFGQCRRCGSRRLVVRVRQLRRADGWDCIGNPYTIPSTREPRSCVHVVTVGTPPASIPDLRTHFIR